MSNIPDESHGSKDLNTRNRTAAEEKLGKAWRAHVNKEALPGSMSAPCSFHSTSTLLQLEEVRSCIKRSVCVHLWGSVLILLGTSFLCCLPVQEKSCIVLFQSSFPHILSVGSRAHSMSAQPASGRGGGG